MPVISSASREYPIDRPLRAGQATGWRSTPATAAERHGRHNRRDLVRHVASVVDRALDDEVGDVLVFLPGSR